ncbi:MAG: hypothetical protein AAGU73_09735, partial [Actinomycetota bacterium]
MSTTDRMSQGETTPLAVAVKTVNLQEIAEMAGVGLSAVSNWQKRYPARDAKGQSLPDAFPSPVSPPDAAIALFDAVEVEAWLAARGKKFNPLQQLRAVLPIEAQLWKAADALRGSMDAAEYKH